MTTKINAQSLIESLDWHQLPQDGGQIVSVTYAADETYLYRRTIDRSDGRLTIERAERLDDEDDFEPWNGLLPSHGPWEDLTL